MRTQSCWIHPARMALWSGPRSDHMATEAADYRGDRRDHGQQLRAAAHRPSPCLGYKGAMALGRLSGACGVPVSCRNPSPDCPCCGPPTGYRRSQCQSLSPSHAEEPPGDQRGGVIPNGTRRLRLVLRAGIGVTYSPQSPQRTQRLFWVVIHPNHLCALGGLCGEHVTAITTQSTSGLTSSLLPPPRGGG